MLLLAEGQLKPKQVDLSRTVNRHAHHTSNYEIPNLVLRRGQAFEMVITFERAFNPNEDSIVLKFVTGQPLFVLKVRTLKFVTGQLLLSLKPGLSSSSQVSPFSSLMSGLSSSSQVSYVSSLKSGLSSSSQVSSFLS